MLLCGGLVLAVSMVINVVWWMIMKDVLEKEALSNGYISAMDSRQKIISSKFDSMVVKDSEEYLKYYLRHNGDDMLLCFMDVNFSNGNGEVYNHTVFDRETLEKLHYKAYEKAEYSYMEYKNGRYIVYRFYYGNFEFFHIRDITSIDEKMEFYRLVSVVITATVMFFLLLFLQIMMTRIMRPLKQLGISSEKISKGVYSERVKVHNKYDEIGILSTRFNSMAEAVENNICQMKEIEQKKNIFMGNLAHELKTPMTAISGYAQTLLYTKLSQEDEEEALMYIYKECERVERLSKKILRLLELDKDEELEKDMKWISVEHLFENAVNSCRFLIDNKNIKILQEAEISQIYGDEDLMTDAVINLLENAIKYSDYGNSIKMSGKIMGNSAFIQIQDWGCGISLSEQKQIMEPFYRVDKSRSRKEGGVGLGLSIVHEIIKKHGYGIMVESIPGEGSKFTICLPSDEYFITENEID